jgi:hypothetical protein
MTKQSERASGAMGWRRWAALLCCVVAVSGGLGFLSSARADDPGPVERQPSAGAFADYGGEWDSEWGVVFLLFEDDAVRGEWRDGYLEGKVDDKGNITFKWASSDGKSKGSGMFVIQKSGRILGSWGFGTSANNGGEWALSRK